MEKSEPSLVPEWLKNSGSTTGGGSISHSDDRPASRTVRNKSSVNNNGHHDIGWPSSSDKTTSSYFRRSSSSNSAVNQRSSYTTSNRNQDTYESRDRSKLALDDRRNRDFSDSLGNNFSSKFESDGLRRSQSMIYGKRNDTWPKKVVTDLSSSISNNSNGLGAKGSPIGNGAKKATFERDFPSLGAEEIGRIPSPGLSSAMQSLPIGIGGEKWTSALVEVPVVVGSNGAPSSTVQPVSSRSSTHVALGTTSSLNMAKTVAQGPIRAQTAPQSSIGNQRLEELAIKQSRQLIPVTPSMAKTLVVNTSDKQKNKVSMQHHMLSSLPAAHSPRSGPMKGDISKPSNGGKLLILNPVREKNGATPVSKDPSTPTTPVVNSTISLSSRGPPNDNLNNSKPVLTVLEKRPTSQAQSRNDFFNLVRKKSMANSASPHPADLAPPNSSPVHDKVTETESVVAPNTPPTSETSLSSGSQLSEENGVEKCNGDADKDINGKKNPSSDPIISEEAEAAFLRSMGWDEDSDEGGLTEEEITAFFRDMTIKYNDSKPSLKILQGGNSNLLSTIGRTDAKLES